MRIKIRTNHPEDLACLAEMDACRERGHGKWLTYPDGFIVCHDCREVLGRFGLEEHEFYIDCGGDADDDIPPKPTLPN